MRVSSDEANRAGSTLLAQYFEDHPEKSPMAGEPDMGDFGTRSFAVQQEVLWLALLGLVLPAGGVGAAAGRLRRYPVR